MVLKLLLHPMTLSEKSETFRDYPRGEGPWPHSRMLRLWRSEPCAGARSWPQSSGCSPFPPSEVAPDETRRPRLASVPSDLSRPVVAGSFEGQVYRSAAMAASRRYCGRARLDWMEPCVRVAGSRPDHAADDLARCRSAALALTSDNHPSRIQRWPKSPSRCCPASGDRAPKNTPTRWDWDLSTACPPSSGRPYSRR